MLNNNIKRVLNQIFTIEQLQNFYNEIKDINNYNIVIVQDKESLFDLARSVKDVYISDDVNIKVYRECKNIIGELSIGYVKRYEVDRGYSKIYNELKFGQKNSYLTNNEPLMVRVDNKYITNKDIEEYIEFVIYNPRKKY